MVLVTSIAVFIYRKNWNATQEEKRRKEELRKIAQQRTEEQLINAPNNNNNGGNGMSPSSHQAGAGDDTKPREMGRMSPMADFMHHSNNSNNNNHLVANSVAQSPQVSHLNTGGSLDANLLGTSSVNHNNNIIIRSAADVGGSPASNNISMGNQNQQRMTASRTPAAPQKVNIATAEQLAEYDELL